MFSNSVIVFSRQAAVFPPVRRVRRRPGSVSASVGVFVPPPLEMRNGTVWPRHHRTLPAA
jgi:hypothetical protein